MTKDEQKRLALIEKLADHMLAHGLAGASLRPMAKAAGTSDRMLLYYFRDKDELIAATAQAVAARLTAMLGQHMAPEPLGEDNLISHLIGVMGDASYWPYMRLWLDMASRAAAGEALFLEIGGQLGRGFVLWIMAQLDAPHDTARIQTAARVLRATEGWMFLKAIGLDDINADANAPRPR